MSGTARARLNGEIRPIPDDATVEVVVSLLCCEVRGVAVALNGEVVPRSAWASVVVGAGDEVEVLGVAAGG